MKKKVEREAFINKHEASEAKRTTAVQKAHRKPYSKKLSEEEKMIADQKLPMRVAHRAKDDSWARVTTLEYTPQSEEEAPQYTHQTREEVPEYKPHSKDKEVEYTPQQDGEMVEDNFDIESEKDLQINYDIVSVQPVEYDRISEVFEVEEDYIQDESVNQKPLCYYVRNNGAVEEQ